MLKWVNIRASHPSYYFDFKNKNKITISPIEAALYTIEYIKANYPSPYTLYLSGGVDSQAMLYAWIISKTDFNTFSAIYNNDFNEHDLVSLKVFSKLHKIEINYQNFDLLTFLENEHDYYANEYFCGSPQITTFMKLTEFTTEGTVIMSGNFIKLQFAGLPDNNNMGLYHYIKKTKRNIVPWFFLETEELAHSFVDTEYITDLKNNRELCDPTFHNYLTKIALYQSYGFPVLPQYTKLNGFEKVKEWYDTNCPRVIQPWEKLQRLPEQISSRNFDLLYRNKYELKFSNLKYNISI